MSNLKHLSLEELYVARYSCEKSISYHQSKANGQQERLKWIEKYIEEKKNNE